MVSRPIWLWSHLLWRHGANCPQFTLSSKSSSPIFAPWWPLTILSGITLVTSKTWCNFWGRATSHLSLACFHCLKFFPRKEWTMLPNYPSIFIGKRSNLHGYCIVQGCKTWWSWHSNRLRGTFHEMNQTERIKFIKKVWHLFQLSSSEGVWIDKHVLSVCLR